MSDIKSIEKIRKEYMSSSGIISIPASDKLKLPSQIIPINYLIGGGIPYGSILEEFGWESTGKSLLAADFASVTQKLGGKVLWNDAEFAFGDSSEFYQELGMNTEDVELLEDDTVEKFSDWAMDMVMYYRSKLTNNEPILLVCDSIAALECEEAQGSKQSGSKREIGNRAKAIYKFYRVRRKLLKQCGVCTIMINQVRDKVGANMFQDSTTTPGGAATAFYASIRLALMKGKAIKEDDLKIGNMVHCFVKKNKVAPPKDKVQTEVYFVPNEVANVGFNKYAGLASICDREGILKKKQGVYRIDDFELGKSRTNLDSYFSDASLRKYVIDKLNINTISKTRNRINSLSKNLFPVPNIKLTKQDEE